MSVALKTRGQKEKKKRTQKRKRKRLVEIPLDEAYNNLETELLEWLIEFLEKEDLRKPSRVIAKNFIDFLNKEKLDEMTKILRGVRKINYEYKFIENMIRLSRKNPKEFIERFKKLDFHLREKIVKELCDFRVATWKYFIRKDGDGREFLRHLTIKDNKIYYHLEELGSLTKRNKICLKTLEYV